MTEGFLTRRMQAGDAARMGRRCYRPVLMLAGEKGPIRFGDAVTLRGRRPSLLAGYCWALSTRAERPVPTELTPFHRGEQMVRLRSAVAPIVGLRG